MLNIALCDDTETELRTLRSFIDSYSKSNSINTCLNEFDSAEALLKSDIAQQCDIIFLDIYMDGLDGMDCAKTLRSSGYEGCFVFVTTSREHAVDGFTVEALDYILKPVTYDHICTTMDRIIRHCKNSLSSITVIVNSQQLEIPLQDIYFIETGSNHNTKLHLKNQTLQSSTLISDIDLQLEEYQNFLRCHRSYIVNMNYIDHMKDGAIILQNGEQVLVPVRKQVETKRLIMDYVCSQMRR